MQVKATGVTEISILGEPQTLNDYSEVKEVVFTLLDKKVDWIHVNIYDATYIQSALIGFFFD